MTTTVSTDRHGPNRFSSYTRIHETVIRQFIDTGFIGSENLEFSSLPYKFRLKGEIACLGDIIISVDKMLEVIDFVNGDPMVQTLWYAYNARVKSCGNFLRYDNQDPDYLRPGHGDDHHKHMFDWRDGIEYPGSPYWVGKKEWPVLGAVITEVQDWYWANKLLLPQSEIYPILDPPSLD